MVAVQGIIIPALCEHSVSTRPVSPLKSSPSKTDQYTLIEQSGNYANYIRTSRFYYSISCELLAKHIITK